MEETNRDELKELVFYAVDEALRDGLPVESVQEAITAAFERHPQAVNRKPKRVAGNQNTVAIQEDESERSDHNGTAAIAGGNRCPVGDD